MRNAVTILSATFIILLFQACGKGPAGTAGTNGAIGSTPAPCSVRDIPGGVDIVCPDGSVQEVHNGIVGPAGPAGMAGRDSTPVIAISLCPRYGATQYPSNWPEQALCVGGNLYGVYWTGSQAFLAEIVPGHYASTSPNGCTFTVFNLCQVKED